MTYLELQNMILHRCGSLSSDEMRARVKTEMTHVQYTELEQAGRFIPWFLLSAFQTYTLVQGQNLIALPSDFIQEFEDNQPWYQTETGWVKINKNPFDRSNSFLESDGGPPRFYEVQRQGYWFHPVADKDYTVRLRYFKREAALVNDADTNKWTEEAADLLIAETGRLICTYHTKDLERAKLFEVDAVKARERLFVRSAAIENTNRLTSMGDD